MIWVSWRQFRGQAIGAMVGLLGVAAILGVTGVHLNHLYTDYELHIGSCNVATCDAVRSRLLDSYHHVRLLGSLLIGLPALIGLFWGAPLITRELESGTHRLAWTQSVTRTRWLVTKLAVVGLASAVAAGLYSFAVTWWAIPFDRINANRLSPAIFDQRGIVPIGYAIFGFALGVTLGVIIRRTVPAMFATLIGFIGTRMLTQYLVRPHLISPMHATYRLNQGLGIGIQTNSSGALSVDAGHPEIHGAWVTGSHLADSAGHAPTSAFIKQACGAVNRLRGPAPPGVGRRQAPPGAQRAFESCIHTVGATFHEVVAYQPASRFWQFQWLETGLFLLLALALAAACVGWVRHRLT
jgi:hypothetical protein